MTHRHTNGGIFIPGGPPAPLPRDTPPPAHASHPRDTDDLREIVRAAAASSTPVRIVGAGLWLNGGRPVHAHHAVHLGALGGIVEHVPGDLTMTARAGTPLATLQAAARAHGQFLPLDPWGGDSGTLGATLATATAGPLAGSLSGLPGLPRDVVLGLTFVSGAGELIRAGGRVVKNVAGFDLVRLTVGAWGTLGAITEATVRLRALPERELTLAIPLPPSTDTGALLAWLRTAPLAPLALELVDSATARAAGLQAPPHDAIIARLAGNDELVEAQRLMLAEAGDPVELDPACWERLRTDHHATGATFRLSAPASRLATLWDAARSIVATLAPAALRTADPAGPGAANTGMACASIARGVVRIQLPPTSAPRLLQVLRQGVPEGVTFRGERLPPELWAALDPGSVANPLARGVRHAFDPHRILNPGILGPEHDSQCPDAHPSRPMEAP